MKSQYEPQNTPESQAQQPCDTPAVAAESRHLVIFAISSLILAIIAWISAYYNGWAGITISAIAIIAGALSLKSRRHAVRNTAITSIIAAAVLFVVILSFIIVIYVGLKHT